MTEPIEKQIQYGKRTAIVRVRFENNPTSESIQSALHVIISSAIERAKDQVAG